MHQSRRFSWLLAPALPLLLAACTGGQPAPAAISATELPDNLCTSIPAEVIDRWSMAELSHESTEGSATCDMSGTYEGKPVALRVVFSTFVGDSADAARDAADADLAEQCGALEEGSLGEGFTQDDNECTFAPALTPEPSPTTVINVARSIPAYGVVRVEMSHGGLGYQLIPAEVVGISAALTTTDPADL